MGTSRIVVVLSLMLLSLYGTSNAYAANLNHTSFSEILTYDNVWWLRSPGYDCGNAGDCSAYKVDQDGTVSAENAYVSHVSGVRPAVVVKLNSLSFKRKLQVGMCDSNQNKWKESPSCMSIIDNSGNRKGFDIIGINKQNRETSGTCNLDSSVFGSGYLDKQECPRNSVMLLFSNQNEPDQKFPNVHFCGGDDHGIASVCPSYLASAINGGGGNFFEGNNYAQSELRGAMNDAYEKVKRSFIESTVHQFQDAVINRSLKGGASKIEGGHCSDGSYLNPDTTLYPDYSDYCKNDIRMGYMNDFKGILLGNPSSLHHGENVYAANFFPLSSAEAYYLRYITIS